jgi:hypothetical protein
MLTLASSWIEAEISTRLSLECTLLICHSLYLQYMGLYLFNGGVNCPLIGKNLVLGWGHTSAQNASVVTNFVTSVFEIERNQ